MKKYSLKEIKKIWRQYKLPVFQNRQVGDFAYTGTDFSPGQIIQGDLEELYSYDNNMSFPEFIEFLEEEEEDRKIEKLKE